MCTSESEKHKEHQKSVTTGHEEAVQESSAEEKTPIITSRSLRRRTVTVISTPQRKSKRLQNTEVEVAEDENVQMTEVMEKIDKNSIEEKEENKDEKMEAEVSAVPNDEDRVPESSVIDQGQMEVVEEVEHVKETSTPQEIPGNEESTIKELSESDLADKTEVADSYPAKVVKDAETEENKDDVIEAEDSTISKDEDRVPDSTDTDQGRMEVEGPAVEMIPGQVEQKAEEATAGLKLQKASVVLVDFNKVPPKQTIDSVTAKEASQPQEELCQELVASADIAYIEQSKAEDEGMKQTETQTESAEKEQADEDVVKIAESENVETFKNKSAEGTSEIRDNNDENMETEGDGVKEDEDRVPELIPEVEPVKETSTLQEIPSKTQIQEPSQADEEKPDTETEEEFSDLAHKADKENKKTMKDQKLEPR
ncbi:midasin AAA ATPase-domain containing protein [Colossoma macropomum]|uniref:midasin AAA ATPase-domain containing protein n=1 Tax=Colossoma macropomum TaxID=42526 RepID=UPI0018640322|nr:midasin AAA ATPase-domain containing protein [Colossoma macropomum]